VSQPVLEELDRILNQGGEPDDVLRAAVQSLAGCPDISWAGIAFLDDGTLVFGPSAGEPAPARRVSVPIVFQGAQVGELLIDGDDERAQLEQIADRLSGHVLIGWDTRGEPWDP
jgi:hypothetical protein